jgi:hypothetical protein
MSADAGVINPQINHPLLTNARPNRRQLIEAINRFMRRPCHAAKDQ